ncbi:MAG: beta-lactamase class [Acetobacteraceae bacterium]|jgi:beta-lactamase class A|nr:beta-lactamase class [Acetobacteraceae bacterium]
MQELIERLNAICDAQPFTTSWCVKDYRTGEQADRGGSIPVPSASTRKISIMMALLRKAHAGEVDLDEPCIMTEALKQDVASGSLRYMTAGLTIRLRDALVQMIILSDNVCTKMVLRHLTLNELNDFCRSAGMIGSTHRFIIPPLGLAWDHPAEAVTTTTPIDQVLLLDTILAGCTDSAVAARLGCSPALCEYAMDVLSWQLHRQMIPALLPYGTKVASKSGRARRGRMDVGIVFDRDKPLYALAGYTDNVPETMPDGLPGYSAVFATIARLSRACWDSMAP